MLRVLLVVSLLLAACDNEGNFLFSEKEVNVDPLSEVNAKLQFTCSYEKIPDSSVESELVFKYARWLQKNNQLVGKEEVFAEVERLYRVAAEHDNFKANINLQNGAMRGQFALHGDEHLRLSQQLIDARVATGYYFVAIFLGQGAAGLQMDKEMALRYYRKAADEGNALAQHYVGDKLAPIEIAPAVALQMYRCAAEQGNGRAAVALGIHLQDAMNFDEALKIYQLGVAAGDAVAALALQKGFSGVEVTDQLNYLGRSTDMERVARYKKIGKILSNYSYASPTVPEINEIVPLPPAKLPPWDGKLQWLEERLANIPPEKPSEALIRKLAKEKVLDPATGKPMPGSPAFSEANFPLMICESGQPCPRSGYWKVMITSLRETTRYFEQGEIMPRYTMNWKEPRIWPLRDKPMQCVKRVAWGLLG